MSIPDGLTREHILEAAKAMDAGKKPEGFGRATTYAVVVGDGRYAPKQLIAVAAKLGLGIKLRPNEFHGGESGTNPVLRKLGFEVVKVEDAKTNVASEALPTTSAVARDIIRAITRHPASRAQLVLFKLTRDAAKEGDAGVKSQTIREALGHDHAGGISGVMMAIGKRVNYTRRETQQRDKPGRTLFFDQHWSGSENIYHARPALLEAIELIPGLVDHLDRPLEEVERAGRRAFSPPGWLNMHPPQLKPIADVVAEPDLPYAVPFQHLLGALDEQGLYYPSSLVANVLLALQTKRFVLLSGISGTGKTRISQAIAQRYEVRRRTHVAAVDDDATVITVQPYMMTYRRFILPGVMGQTLVSHLEKGSNRFTVAWPGGKLEATVWVRNAVQILMRSGLRKWFEANFQEGAQFLARLETDDDGMPTTVRLDRVKHTEEQEEKIENYQVVAVRPDWTDSRGLLGYYNPITEQYMSTPFLRLLLRADDELARAKREERSPHPFFVVLDEMNLARVEHYFSDFLSALESGEPLDLHDIEEIATLDEDAGLAIPRKLNVPENLFFVGTVNVDESTVMFSPKVLDRAFTIELTDVDLEGFAGRAPRSSDLDLAAWDGRLSPEQCRKPERADWREFAELLDGALVTEVLQVHKLLAVQGRHFGYRVANEVARFVLLATQQARDPEAAAWEALDFAILQKVLVKLHGTQAELGVLLDRLLTFALVGASGMAGPFAKIESWAVDPVRGEWSLKDGPSSPTPSEAPEPEEQEAEEQIQDETARFPRSAFKLWRMRRRLHQQGFTAWVE